MHRFQFLGVLSNSGLQLDEGHALCESGNRVCDLLYPENLCGDAQPLPKTRAPCADEPPELKPLSLIASVASGKCKIFVLPMPHVDFPLYPWQSYGTVRQARSCLDWLDRAFEQCATAAKCAASQPVCLDFGMGARKALPAVWAWFRDLGFSVQGERLWSPVFTP